MDIDSYETRNKRILYDNGKVVTFAFKQPQKIPPFSHVLRCLAHKQEKLLYNVRGKND